MKKDDIKKAIIKNAKYEIYHSCQWGFLDRERAIKIKNNLRIMLLMEIFYMTVIGIVPTRKTYLI